jgi:hypothetical protein
MIPYPNFRNPNVFQPEGALKTDNPLPALTIRCPHCRKLAAFHAIGMPSLVYSKAISDIQAYQLRASIRMCPNPKCLGLVFTIECDGQAIRIEPPELIDFDLTNLPHQCLVTLREAISCHAAGAYRAAAMMVRRLLEEICHLNNAPGKNLHERLNSLRTQITLPVALFDAMGELKALGNDAAHIEAKDYDKIGQEEAADSIELAKEILKALYQLQSLVNRLQARKNSTQDALHPPSPTAEGRTP